jgi:hypothetical protein
MDHIKLIKSSSLLIGFVFLFFLMIVEQVDAQTIVSVSPDCGPTTGFSINFNTNGFAPNGNVYWQFINSDGQVMLGPFGMFATNSTGGFNEVTHTGEQSPDVYTLHFFDDIDKDGKLDQGGARFLTNVVIPC